MHSSGPRRRRSCSKCTELEQRISALESKIGALSSKTDELRETSHEVSTVTTGNAENVTQQSSNSIECIDLTKQNESSEPWRRQGARPKSKKRNTRTVRTSTPVNSDVNSRPRIRNTDRSANHRACGPRGDPEPLKLWNRFECLQDVREVFPREKTQNRQRANHNNRKTGTDKKQHSAPVHPTTLILGDSTVRLLNGERMIVCCFPNVSVSDTKNKLAELVSKYTTIKRIIVHVGANDIYKEQLYVQQDFKELFSALFELGLQTFISGPLPAEGSFVFTRLFSLNTWLAKTCFSVGMNFIDNFNLFWNRREYFRPKSTELSWTGAKILTQNYHLSLLHPTFSLPTLSQASDKRSVATQTEQAEDINMQTLEKHKQPEQQCPATSTGHDKMGAAKMIHSKSLASNSAKSQQTNGCHEQEKIAPIKAVGRLSERKGHVPVPLPTSVDSLPPQSHNNMEHTTGILANSEATNPPGPHLADGDSGLLFLDFPSLHTPNNHPTQSNYPGHPNPPNIPSQSLPHHSTTQTNSTGSPTYPSPSPLKHMMFPATMERLLPAARQIFNSPRPSALKRSAPPRPPPPHAKGSPTQQQLHESIV